MNVDEAGRAHRGGWTRMFHAAMVSHAQLDAAALMSEDCALGHWLQNAGRLRHGADPVYEVCVAAHAALHREAGKVADAINAGKRAQAEALMGKGTRYAMALTAMEDALDQLASAADRQVA